MIECFIVRMESTNWVLFILCLNSVQETNKVKHNQLNESLSASLLVIHVVALGCSSTFLSETLTCFGQQRKKEEKGQTITFITALNLVEKSSAIRYQISSITTPNKEIKSTHRILVINLPPFPIRNSSTIVT